MSQSQGTAYMKNQICLSVQYATSQPVKWATPTYFRISACKSGLETDHFSGTVDRSTNIFLGKALVVNRVQYPLGVPTQTNTEQWHRDTT